MANPRKKMLKSGKVSWEARYRDPTGKGRSRSFPTRREAVAFLESTGVALRSGEWVDPKSGGVPLRTLAREHVDRATRPNTISGRTSLLNHLGDLADVPVGKLTTPMVEAWAAGLKRGGRSDSTVNTYLLRLKSVLTRATQDGLVPRNVASGVKVGDTRMQLDRADIPTAGQVARMIEVTTAGASGTVDDEQVSVRPSTGHGLAVHLGAVTGMRVGEVVGLRPIDVDMVAGTLTVRQQRGGHPLKTWSSARTISVDEDTMRLIREHLEAYSPGEREQLVRGPLGGAIRTLAIQARIRTLISIGEWPAGMTFHSLRHFHATTLLGAGVPVQVVSRRLGHASAATTLEVYAHVLAGDDARAAEVSGALLRDLGGIEGGLRVVGNGG